MSWTIELSGAGLYILASAGLIYGFVTKRSLLRRYATMALAAGFAVGLLRIVLLATSASQQGQVPFVGASEIFALLAWILITIILLLQVQLRYFTIAAMLSPVAVICALVGVLLPKKNLPVTGDISSHLFSVHVTVLLVGIGSFCLASLTAFLYLIRQRELKTKKFVRIFSLLPPLEDLDRLAIHALVFGFLFLTAGIGTGIGLAHTFWPGNWVHYPKFIFSVVTWAWYLLLLVVRFYAGWRGIRFFVLIVVGFVFLLFTFLGVTTIFQTSYWETLQEFRPV